MPEGGGTTASLTQLARSTVSASYDPYALLAQRMADPTLSKLADDGYSVFFNTFVQEDPVAYISFQTFCYKHLANPQLLDRPAVIEYKNDSPVAMLWFMGLPVLVDGEEQLWAGSGDYCAYGAGRGMAAMRTLVAGKKLLADQGVPYRLGAPGDEGYRVSSRLGNHLVAELPTFVFREQRTRAPSSLELKLSVSTSCPFTEADYALLNGVSGIRVKRSPDFYAWRADGLRKREFTYVTARTSDAALVGFLLAETCFNFTRIVDWQLLGDEHQKSAVLEQLVSALSPWLGYLEVRNLNEARGETDLFARVGFGPLKYSSGEVATLRLCLMASEGELPEELVQASRWTIREVDFDYHLNTHVVR